MSNVGVMHAPESGSGGHWRSERPIHPSIDELIRNAAADQAIEGLELTPEEQENVRREIDLELRYVRGETTN